MAMTAKEKPLTDLEEQYIRWKQVTGGEHRLSALPKSIKFRFENNQWQQVQPKRDLFKDFDDVKYVCGDGDNLSEMACWLDTYNWSLMNKTKFTEDIYQFISHRAQIMRKGVDKEIDNFHINEEMKQQLVQTLKDKIILTLEVFN
jgi:hypothetical protein